MKLEQIKTIVARKSGAFGEDKSGVAAVEFAMIVPIMLTLFFGSVEFSQALTVDRRVAQIASSTADLVAQYDQISPAQVNNLFLLTKSLMQPYDTAPLKISVTNIKKVDQQSPTGVWSCPFQGAPTYVGPIGASIPAGLLENPPTGGTSCVVMSEVKYQFTPTIGQFLTSGVPLTEKFYLKPRKSTCVALTVPSC